MQPFLPVECASSTNVTLSGHSSVGGVTTREHASGPGFRVLCFGQTNGLENGPWIAKDGAWVRPDDCDLPDDFEPGRTCYVKGGTYAGQTYKVTTGRTFSSIDGRLATAEGEIDALQNSSGAYAADIGTLQANELETPESGHCPYAEIDLSGGLAAGDLFVIGADTYELVAAAGSVTVDTYVAVLHTGVLQTDLEALIAAINGTAANPSASCFLIDTVTPAIGIGTELVGAADSGSSVLGAYPAVVQGGLQSYSAPPAIALNATLGTPSSWNLANFNLGSGAPTGRRLQAFIAINVTTAKITAGTETVLLDFIPTGILVGAFRSKVPVHGFVDQFKIEGPGVVITYVGGLTDLLDGDIAYIHAWGASA